MTRENRLIYFSCPSPARRRRPCRTLLARNGFRRALPGLGNWCVDSLTLLFERDTPGRDVMSVLAVVSPHLKSQDNVKNKCKEETRQNKRVLNLGGGGEQPGETAKDLRHNGKGRQLSSRLCPVVLCDLRELGEQPERESSHLEERDGFLGKINQCADQGSGGNGRAGNLWSIARRGC